MPALHDYIVLHDCNQQEDLASVGLLNAEVIRSDPTNLCEAGLCPNGPQAAWGHTWSFTLVSDVDIVEATSPLDTSPTVNDTLPLSFPFLSFVNVTSSVPGKLAVRLLCFEILVKLIAYYSHWFSSQPSLRSLPNSNSNLTVRL